MVAERHGCCWSFTILMACSRTYAMHVIGCAKGIAPSDRFKKHVKDVNARSQAKARLVAHADTNPIRPAEQRYMQEHGSPAYQQLLRRLFGDLFPPD
jgi:hypothetical protein